MVRLASIHSRPLDGEIGATRCWRRCHHIRMHYTHPKQKRKVNHGSLFSGIGGFDLAAEWMGWNNVFNCEWEEFPRKVLKHHFPNSKQYGDIKQFSAIEYHGRIDVLTGGFPCQPYSSAGKRLGKADERHLWPEMLRIVQECAPRYVVGENVFGLIGWNGGMVFDEVCTDLENCGYAVQSYVLPACAVNAPHRRNRIWFVAYAGGGDARPDEGGNQSTQGNVRGQDTGNVFRPLGGHGIVADTDNARTDNDLRTDRHGEAQNEGRKGFAFAEHRPHGIDGDVADTDGARRGQNHGKGKPRFVDQARPGWESFPTQPPVCGGNDGIPSELDGITFSKWRRESIKGYGNAIVPQVAFEIFKAIEKMDQTQ